MSDFTIGLSDGLTVPFALTAGLSALGDARVVVFGGLAELVAGAISMGVAGYLGAKGEKYVSKVSYRKHTSHMSGNLPVNFKLSAAMKFVPGFLYLSLIHAWTLLDLNRVMCNDDAILTVQKGSPRSYGIRDQEDAS